LGLDGIDGGEVLLPGGLEEAGIGGEEGDFETLCHFPGDDDGGELEGFLGAEVVVVEELSGGFKDSRVEGLLDHARGLKSEDVAGGLCVLGRDVSGAFAAEQCGVDVEGSDGGDELAVVFCGFHEADHGVRTRLLDEEFDESC